MQRCHSPVRSGWLFLCGALLLAMPCWSEAYKLGGSGGGLATMQALAEAFTKQDASFSLNIVPNLGSGGGLKALAGKAIDIAITARPLKDNEKSSGLQATLYAHAPLVFATNKTLMHDITTPMAAEIYEGRRTHWPDQTPIRLIMRPSNDGETEVLQSTSAVLKSAVTSAYKREGLIISITAQDAAEKLEKLPGSFGVASLSTLVAENHKLNILSLDGKPPLKNGKANPQYPMNTPFYFVTSNNPPAQIQQFWQFIRSAQGKAILEKTGHWTSD